MSWASSVRHELHEPRAENRLHNEACLVPTALTQIGAEVTQTMRL